MPDEIRYPGVHVFEPPSTPEEEARSEAVFQNLAAPYEQPTIVRVGARNDEPEGSDHIEIGRRPDGYGFSGTVMTRDIDGKPVVRVFVTGAIGMQGPFGTADEAEAAAVEWAAKQGATTLYELALRDE